MRKFFYFLPLFFFTTSNFGQSGNDVENFIDDILLIAGEFSAPAASGAAYQAGSGWFNSAIPLEKWDFRFSLHGNALIIPSEKKFFRLNNSDLKIIQVEGSEGVNLPTAFGGVSTTVLRGEINFLDENFPVAFDAIDGIGRDYVPHAFVQFAVGVSAGTEIKFRAMPDVTIDGITASTYGLGVKHSLSQYFDQYPEEGVALALGAGYSKLNVQYGFQPQGAEGIVLLDQIVVSADLFMVEVIASKKWNVFELFGAAGLMNSSFNYTFDGTGTYLDDVNTQVDLLEDSNLQFKGDLGFNIHFGRFRLSTMATIGEFLNANVGLGVQI